MSVIGVQKRMMELGRVRLGEKGPKGEPKRLSTFRFTSASRTLLDAVAARYGGRVTDWEGAPDEGYYQVTTEAKELEIILPPVFSAADGSPTTAYSQFYEQWSGGGCQRRCDGVTEALSGKPCMCNPDDRACEITTRMSCMLPEIPGLGVWRLDSKGWNAAVELPGTLEVLMMAAARSAFVPAVLRIEHRTKKEPGKGTRRFVVPVLDLPGVRIGELLAATAGQPAPVRLSRPELPAGAALPADPVFEHDGGAPGFGEPPPVAAVAAAPGEEVTADAVPAGAAGAAEGDEWADEAAEAETLNLAAAISEDAYKTTRKAVDAHRAKHGGVNAVWLAKLTDALAARMAAAEPAAEPAGDDPAGEEPLFRIPNKARA